MMKTLKRLLPALVTLATFAGVGVGTSGATAVAPTITSLSKISCATATHCWALGTATSGGVILDTTNGGGIWKAEITDSPITIFLSIACPSLSHCWVVGLEGASSRLIATADGGSTWKHQTLPQAIAELQGVSCTSNSLCWAVGITSLSDAVVFATRNGGVTWKAEKVPKLGTTMGSVFGISCSSPKDCVVVGLGAITTTNGGATWTFRKVPKGEPALQAVSCSSTKDCVALGNAETATFDNEVDIVTTSDGGINWKMRVRGIGNLSGVSCSSTKDCVVVGQRRHCATKACVTGTSSVEISSSANGGITWNTQKVPAGVAYLSGVSCGSTKDCVAVGDAKSGAAIIGTTNGGSTWKPQKP
jgi:photosystem II stability/assembly factor-like uncharacterized protein